MSKDFQNFQFKKHAESQSDEEKVKSAYDSLKDLDEATLNKKLESEVARQKQTGQFNYDLLKSSVESMRPFLSCETYDNLKNLLEKIK